MSVPRPHFLLFCDGTLPTLPQEGVSISQRGRWKFILEDVEGGGRLEAADAEASSAPDRLALLAVVRGLEALEQPSRVTLVTASRYVTRGMQYGLSEWRENNYCWEHFGVREKIRNSDLWQRIDHAMQYHSIHCRLMTGSENSQEHDPTHLGIESIPISSAIVSESVLPDRDKEVCKKLSTDVATLTSIMPPQNAWRGIDIDSMSLWSILKLWLLANWRRHFGSRSLPMAIA